MNWVIQENKDRTEKRRPFSIPFSLILSLQENNSISKSTLTLLQFVVVSVNDGSEEKVLVESIERQTEKGAVHEPLAGVPVGSLEHSMSSVDPVSQSDAMTCQLPLGDPCYYTCLKYRK